MTSTRKAQAALYKNLTSSYEPYSETDLMLHVWGGDLDLPADAPIEQVADAMFSLHNRDDRPGGPDWPSMSVGDVVHVGGGSSSDAHDRGRWLACDRSGWKVVAPLCCTDRVAYFDEAIGYWAAHDAAELLVTCELP